MLRTSLTALLLVSASPALATEPEPRNSLTLDVLAPPLLGAVLNTYGTFLEYQTPVHPHASLIAEFGYLKSPNFRTMAGVSTGLKVDFATWCIGAAWWLSQPFEGLFVSVRVEGWLAAAQNASGNAAIGNAFDANFQPGWQWRFGAFTVIAGLSLAYVTGPIQSPDEAVEFPVQGFSATPHLRLGAVW